MSDSDSDDEFYEVEKVVDHRAEGRKVFYKVRWKGYPPSQDTWEPQDHLGDGCEEIIDAYFELKRQKEDKVKPKKKGGQSSAASSPSKEAKSVKQEKSTSAQASLSSTSASSTSATTISSSTTSATTISASTSSASTVSGSASSASTLPKLNTDKSSATTVDGSLSPTDVFSDKFPASNTKETTPVPTAKIASQVANVKSEPSTQQSQKYQAKQAKSSAPSPNTTDSQVVPQLCSHPSEFDNERSQQYRTISQQYEVRGQGVSDVDEQKATNHQKKCVTVLMSRLCDPDEPDLFDTLEKLQDCMRQWNSLQRITDNNLSLISAILTLHEGLILQNKQSYLASINRAIPGNWTPLHFAAALYKFEVCTWLLEAGVWPDIISINKETPLSLALKHPEAKNYSEKLQRFVNRLICHGVNAAYVDTALKSPSALAKKSKCHLVANMLLKQQQRLRRWITDIVVTHLDKHPDNLYIGDFFLEPQLVTQPPGLTYSLKFKFKAPHERCVARLTVVYYRNQPSLPQSEDITEQPLILNTDAAFPFKTFTINGTDIKPANPKHMSVNLKSEMIVGPNTLEMEMCSSITNHADSVLIFGCLIAKTDE